MKKLFICLLPLLLSACLFSTPNSTFYLLESSSQAESVFQKKLNVAVYDVGLPDYLQKPQIVLQKHDSPELKVSEFNRWASDLDGMVQNTLIENLQKSFPQSTIKPLVFGSKATYIVKVNIEKMTGYFRQEAFLSGTWQIISQSGQILKQSDFNFQTEAGTTYASYVQAQSKLIFVLSEELSENLNRF